MTNAYWDAVAGRVVDGVVGRRFGPREHDAWEAHSQWCDGLRSHFSWTITDPATVDFVAEHLGEYAVDPMAGTGWWGHVLRPRVSLVGYDIDPAPTRYGIVERADAVWAAHHAGDLSLFLSWPPMHDPVGERTVRAYRGNRIVHIGSAGWTKTGTPALFDLLATEWRVVAEHTPVRWYGAADTVTVHERA